MDLEGKTFKTLKNITLRIWLILSLIFAIYFVYLDSSALFLYSFPLFILVSFLIFNKERILIYVAIIAISLLLISFVGFYFLPFLRFSQGISILGFYLFISACLALLIHEAYINNFKDVSISRKTVGLLKKASAIAVLALLILSVIVIALPIWPVRSCIYLNNMPYMPVTLSIAANNASHDGLYLIAVNSSRYIGLINSSVPNILFYYNNGTPVTAYWYGNIYNELSQNYDTYVFLFKLRSSSINQTHIRLYLLPYNISYYVPFSSDNVSVSGYINASFGKIENAGAYSNTTIKYIRNVISNTTRQMNYTEQPYYSIYNFNFGGIYTSVNLTATKNVSIFAIQNLNGITSPPYNISERQGEYDYYVRELSGLSYEKTLNATHSYITENGDKHFSYIVVTDWPVSLHIKITTSYIVATELYNSTERIPAEVVKKPIRTGSLPQVVFSAFCKNPSA